MPKFVVHAPITMSVACFVEAENEDAAMDAAFALDFSLMIDGAAKKLVEIQDMEMHRHVVKGNVFYGVLRSMEAERTDE